MEDNRQAPKLKPSDKLALVSVGLGLLVFGFFWHHDFPTVGVVLGLAVAGGSYGAWAKLGSDLANMDREHHERDRWGR